MTVVALILLIVAVVLFLVAAAGVGHPRINLLALGLAFFAAAFLVRIAASI